MKTQAADGAGNMTEEEAGGASFAPSHEQRGLDLGVCRWSPGGGAASAHGRGRRGLKANMCVCHGTIMICERTPHHAYNPIHILQRAYRAVSRHMASCRVDASQTMHRFIADRTISQSVLVTSCLDMAYLFG